MQNNKCGFTLMEVLLVIGIVSITLTAMMQLYVYTTFQAKIASEKTTALAEAQNKIEEIRYHNFSSITTDYGAGGTPGDVFSLEALTGRGLIYINSDTADLLTIDIPVCWLSSMGRIIGEDANLNGILELSEDVDGDGMMDSPVTLTTIITQK